MTVERIAATGICKGEYVMTEREAIAALIEVVSTYRKAHLYGGPCCSECSDFDNCEGEQCTGEWTEIAQERAHEALKFFGINIDRRD